MKLTPPSMDAWLKEAKAHESAPKIGMYLTHNGTVRQTAKAKVRHGMEGTAPVTGMFFSFDREKVDAIIEDTYKMDGIYYIRVWLNEGRLEVGDDIMYVLIGGDIRPHVVDGLQYLVGRIKDECVTETELYPHTDAIAYSKCGMRCDLCLVYRPNVEKQDRRREICNVWSKIWEGFQADPDTVICDGCCCEDEDAVLFSPGCKARECVIEKGHIHCGYCGQYPCGIFPAEPSEEETVRMIETEKKWTWEDEKLMEAYACRKYMDEFRKNHKI